MTSQGPGGRLGLAAAGLLVAGIMMGCAGSVAAQDAAEAAPVAQAGPATVDARSSGYRLRYDDVPPLAERQLEAGLTMRGRGSRGRIVDAAGNVAWQGSEATPLYGLRISPDGRRALLYFGNATYSVRPGDDLASAGTTLPVQPPRARATGFGEWHWLDDNRLLGVAEIPAVRPGPGATAAEIESQPPEATLLSVYDLRDSVLAPVEVGDGLPAVFEIGEIRGNHIELQVEGAMEPIWTVLDVGTPD